MSWKPYECIMHNSTCFQESHEMKRIKGIMFNSNGYYNVYLKRYVQPDEGVSPKLGENKSHNDFNHTERHSGFTFWIGKFDNNTVGTVQTLPINYQGWGSGSQWYNDGWNMANNGWIQCVILRGIDEDDAYWKQAVEEVINVSEYVCKTYNLDPLGTSQEDESKIKAPVIMSRNEAYGLHLASSEDGAWFLRNTTMDKIRKRVKERL